MVRNLMSMNKITMKMLIITRIGCIHGWGTIIGIMTPFCLMSKVLKQGFTKLMLWDAKQYKGHMYV